MSAYRDALEVRRVAEEIIPKWHPHLEDVEIRYVFRDEHATAKGKAVMGKARLVGGLNAWLAAADPDLALSEPERFYVMEIAEDVWQTLDGDARSALVDHELCHMVLDEGTEKLTIVGHDVEEFADIIRRHGLWKPDVEAFVKAGMQGRLPFDEYREGAETDD